MSRSSKTNVRDYRARTLRYYNRQYENIARSLFIWEGVPEYIPEDYIERKLYEEGSLLIGDDPMAGVFATRYTQSGTLDMYDRPLSYIILNNNPHLAGKELSAEDVVIIRNNPNMTPTREIVEKSTRELTEIAITKLSNQTAQRIPVLLLTERNMVQSLISVMEGAQNGDGPAVIGVKGFDIESVDIIDNRQEYLGAELRNEERMVVGELLTALGINNLEISKNERLVAAEAEINKEEVGVNLLSFLKTREEAAEKINQLFGLNVSVKVNPLLVVKEEEQEGTLGWDEVDNENA